MATKSWQVIKVRYCHHAEENVGMEVQMVYPIDMLPDQQPRVTAHRCTRAVACNIDGRSSCVWAGTNPAFDPFSEPD